ncbi:hypothetical protein HU200_018474 [Digitaria exilis]|uniref:Glutathione S-transferase n=1 Tax=Digitaria exilis TaxID=1010633 RepID=A0A835F4G7_9POAL|nr:hypothetical protein HU200_018474 [Digitaria exilis]
MAGGELKLLGTWASPFAMRVKLALNFKGLSYDNIEEDLRNKSDLLISSNPVHKKVPVLIHNGKPICESRIIVEYIDEAFVGTGPSLLPADLYERAIARFWAAYIDNKLLASWFQTFTGKTEEEKAEAVKQTLAAAEHMEAAFKECSKGKPFFGGNSVGYVDVTLGSLVALVRTSETYDFKPFDATRSPLLNAWLERFAALDAVKTVVPDTDRLVDYAKTRLAEAAAAVSNN